MAAAQILSKNFIVTAQARASVKMKSFWYLEGCLEGSRYKVEHIIGKLKMCSTRLRGTNQRLFEKKESIFEKAGRGAVALWLPSSSFLLSFSFSPSPTLQAIGLCATYTVYHPSNVVGSYVSFLKLSCDFIECYGSLSQRFVL